MAGLVDVDDACTAFARTHDWNQDVPTFMGVDACPHFGPWAEALLPANGLTDENRALSKHRDAQPDAHVTRVLVLLEGADVPPAWTGALGALTGCNERQPVAWAAVHALYGVIADRLSAPLEAREDAVSLAHLVEATTLYEAWVIKDTESYNYVPMGTVAVWWQTYLEHIDEWVTADDLQALSEVAGGVSETESMSSVTPPARLTELYAASPSSGVAANSRLPGPTVNASMSSDWNLLFHPNADPEVSWAIIRQALEDGEGEDLASCMQPFDNMRDDSWAAWAEFAVDGPHADLLRGRIAGWCADNMDDGDERDELLDMLGIEAERIGESAGDDDEI